MCWSIHKTNKSMDHLGKATDYNFSVISHSDRLRIIEFSLCQDNFCWAAGLATSVRYSYGRFFSCSLCKPLLYMEIPSG